MLNTPHDAALQNCAAHTVWVVFVDPPRLSWQKVLKSGFRHCFAVLEFGPRAATPWLLLDPTLKQSIALAPILPVDFHPGKTFRVQGATVVRVPITPSLNLRSSEKATGFPLRLFSCVEVVKHLIALRDSWVCTPYQLYKTLCRQGHAIYGQRSQTGYGMRQSELQHQTQEG